MTSPLRWWAGAWLVAAVGSGLAAEPAASAPRIASKEEYLSCMQAQDAIEAKKEQLVAQEKKLKAQDAKFQAAEADLAAQVKRHAPASDHEVRSYNHAVAARNASAQAFNRDNQALQRALAQFNEWVADNNARCGSLRFSPEDVEAVNEERRNSGLPQR